MLSKPVTAGAGAGLEGAGLVRLKADAEVEVAGLGGSGAVKSKRSPMPELAAGGGDFADTGAGAGADVKSPKSPKPLDMRAACGLAAGAAGCFGGAGLVSKKLPPLRELVRAVGEVRFENGAGFDGCCWAVGEGPKLNPPKASAMPPNEDVEAAGNVTGGEANPPKAFDAG